MVCHRVSTVWDDFPRPNQPFHITLLKNCQDYEFYQMKVSINGDTPTSSVFWFSIIDNPWWGSCLHPMPLGKSCEDPAVFRNGRVAPWWFFGFRRRTRWIGSSFIMFILSKSLGMDIMDLVGFHTKFRGCNCSGFGWVFLAESFCPQPRFTLFCFQPGSEPFAKKNKTHGPPTWPLQI